jgi:acetolactate synthase-1/2/3 large subunit
MDPKNNEPKGNKVIGGEVVAAMLAKEGVDTVFGIIDGTYMGLYASFEKHGIKLVSPRHETSAAHMAGAYARLTGKLGVCMASNGPGVANILPGVAVESGEGNRVLLLTSSRRQGITYPDRGGTYQYFDQVGVTRGMTKWCGTVPTFDRIPELMRRAFRVSHAGRPGVVHVDIPENIFNGAFEIEEDWATEPSTYRRTEPLAPAAKQVKAVAQMLRQAERPLIHAGSGVIHAGAFSDLAQVAAHVEVPVCTSWAARAALSDADPRGIPIYAMETLNKARTEADLVLVLGSRLGETDWWGKAPRWGKDALQRVVQVDIDEEVLGVNKRTEMAVLADVGAFLAALSEELNENPVPDSMLDSRRVRLAELGEMTQSTRGELDLALGNDAVPMHSAQVPAACNAAFGDDAVVVLDGGNTAVWGNFFHQVKSPNTVLSTYKFGMLGAGVGQALGAKVARPDAPVFCIIGDGAMAFHVQELETAVRAKVPVTFLVLCDKQWGMVKLTQQFGLGDMRRVMGVEDEGTINADFEEIRFDEVARAMGAHGERVSDARDLPAALERCQKANTAAVIHVDVDPMMHLWAPGLQEFKEMHQEPGAAS